MRQFKPSPLIFNFKYTNLPNLKVISGLLIFTIFSVPFVETSFSDRSLFFAWLSVGGFVTTIVIALLFIMKYLCEKRFGERSPLALVIVVAGVIGALKGASTEYLVNFVTINSSQPWDDVAIRAFTGGFLGAGLAFAFSLRATYSGEISASYNRYHQENQSLAGNIATLVQELSIIKKESEERMLRQIVDNITPIKTLDLLASDPEKNWRKISEALRLGLAKRVRQESYDLNYLGDRPLSLKEQIPKLFLLERVNLHPKVLALIQFSVGASVIYSDLNLRNSFLQLFMNIFVSVIVTTGFRALLIRKPNPSKLFNLGIISGLIIVLGSFYALIGYLLWSEIDLFFQASVFFWHTFLILTISSVSEIIQHMERQKDLQETVNQDLIKKKRVLEGHVENYRHEISKHLHGFLIAKIHTSTSLLDRYAKNGDFEGYKVEFSQLLREFTIEGLRKSLNRDDINSEFFSALEDSWNGMIEVSINVPENLHQMVKNAQRIELAHVIEELISNAYRHGEAPAITINITWIDSAFFEIVARDNGKGAITSVKPGLGSRVFEAASRGDWSLRDIPYQGVEVRLTIELYEPESQIVLIPSEHEDADQPVGHTP